MMIGVRSMEPISWQSGSTSLQDDLTLSPTERTSRAHVAHADALFSKSRLRAIRAATQYLHAAPRISSCQRQRRSRQHRINDDRTSASRVSRTPWTEALRAGLGCFRVLCPRGTSPGIWRQACGLRSTSVRMHGRRNRWLIPCMPHRAGRPLPTAPAAAMALSVLRASSATFCDRISRCRIKA